MTDHPRRNALACIDERTPTTPSLGPPSSGCGRSPRRLPDYTQRELTRACGCGAPAHVRLPLAARCAERPKALVARNASGALRIERWRSDMAEGGPHGPRC